ncbi:hypothetical protein HOA59_01375 [archaeon]|jgi:hypothetical protein|nr:hypothetical protein [archaeon]MBT6824066.1 hypothetical protein [archaeon]MBT7107089.1 hypothetical protein [archaeon]MBT7297701.1 hypothetical protein [archaeon]
MKNKLFMLLLMLFSMVKIAAARAQSSTSLNDVLTYELELYNLKGEFWVIMLSFLIVFCIIFLATTKVPFFNDQEKIANLFSIVFSLIVVTSSPITTAFTWTVLNVGGWTLIFFAIIAVLFAGYAELKGNISDTASELGSERRDLGSIFKRVGKLRRKENKLWKKIKRELINAKRDIKKIREDKKRDDRDRLDRTDVANVTDDLDSIYNLIDKSFRDVKKLRRATHSRESRKMKDILNYIREKLQLAGVHLRAGEKGDALSQVNEALKKWKRNKKFMAKLFANIAHDYEEAKAEEQESVVREGEDRKQIAAGKKEEIEDAEYEEIQEEEKRRKIGFERDKEREKSSAESVKEKRRKENEIVVKLLDEKIKKINPLFNVNLAKHPKKAKNYIKDIRKGIDNKLVKAVSNLGYGDDFNAYLSNIDQIVSFLNAKKPYEVSMDEWDNIIKNARSYKEFLLVIRDKALEPIV